MAIADRIDTRLRVAVIEDEPIIREMLTRHLRDSRCKVIWSDDSLDRFWSLPSPGDVDVLILDVGLPNQGMDDIKRVLASYNGRVIIWTSHRPSTVRRSVEGLACVVSVLRKEPDFKALDSTLDRLRTGQVVMPTDSRRDSQSLTAN